jgi:hypothetical protein
MKFLRQIVSVYLVFLEYLQPWAGWVLVRAVQHLVAAAQEFLVEMQVVRQ